MIRTTWFRMLLATILARSVVGHPLAVRAQETTPKGMPNPDPFVLNFHVMHPGGASTPGDPNAAIYSGGLYHLHYILQHPFRGRQSFSFVHLTSTDMLHWRWQPTKLQPAFTGHGMFSGTAFVTRDGKVAATYHGQGAGKNQLVVAKDARLTAWEKPYPYDIRNTDGSPANVKHWDPDCFTIGDTYYAISGGTKPPLFKSKDMRTWTLVGDFLKHEQPDTTIGEDISCPNFFKLGDQWMLLCISHPLGCRYYLGDWDATAEQFVPRRHGRMNWRREEQPTWGLFRRTDFFAPESLRTPDGRRVMWAWLTSPGPGNRLLEKTIQSLPRELSLPADGVLRIKPLRELETLRTDPIARRDVRLNHPVTDFMAELPPSKPPFLQPLLELPGESLEIRATIARGDAERKLFGFVLFADTTGHGLPILLRPETGTIRVGTTEAPFKVADLPAGEDVELRIFIDRYLVEVFVNDRQAVVAAHLEHVGKRTLHGFTLGAPTTLKTLDVWKIQPTNQGFLDARVNRVWEPRTE